MGEGEEDTDVRSCTHLKTAFKNCILITSEEPAVAAVTTTKITTKRESKTKIRYSVACW